MSTIRPTGSVAVTPLIMVKNAPVQSSAPVTQKVTSIQEMREVLQAGKARREARPGAIQRMEAKLNHPAFAFTQTQRDAIKAFIEEIR